MKLLLENWRKYLEETENENSPYLILEELSEARPDEFQNFLTLLHAARDEADKKFDESEETKGRRLEEEATDSEPKRHPSSSVGAIFCDMDGVLADFPGGLLRLVNIDLINIPAIKAAANEVVKIAGTFEYYLKKLRRKLRGSITSRQDHKKISDLEEEAEKYFKLTGLGESGLVRGWERFFKRLPVTPGGIDLWNEIGPHGVILLTGAPGGEGVKHAKIQWVKEHLTPRPISIVKQSDKSPYAFNKKLNLPNLLIDDWNHNIEDWKKAGGIAVQFNEKNPQSAIKTVAGILEGPPYNPRTSGDSPLGESEAGYYDPDLGRYQMNKADWQSISSLISDLVISMRRAGKELPSSEKLYDIAMTSLEEPPPYTSYKEYKAARKKDMDDYASWFRDQRGWTK